jgi:hypothetical protein
MRRLIFSIFALASLFVVGCEEKHEPYYVLWAEGTVVNEAGEPIQGIHIYPEGGNFPGREGYTDYQGYFSGNCSVAPRDRWIIYVEDVDGDYNGGEYEGLSVDITDMVRQPIAPDEWGYSGSCSVDLGTIVLKHK